MATVNFSVPDEVKEQFNRVLARENKSSIIARLMMQAVEERRLQKTRARAVTERHREWGKGVAIGKISGPA